MQPPNETFFTLLSKAGSNVVESAGLLMEFVVAPDPDGRVLLWGAHAQGKKPIITAIRGSEANILKSSHPAPPACYRPCGSGPAFVESHPFRNANRLLKSSGGEIDWNLM